MLILFKDPKIFFFIILEGTKIFKISVKNFLKKKTILINLNPEVVEINEPPTKVVSSMINEKIWKELFVWTIPVLEVDNARDKKISKKLVRLGYKIIDINGIKIKNNNT